MFQRVFSFPNIGYLHKSLSKSGNRHVVLSNQGRALTELIRNFLSDNRLQDYRFIEVRIDKPIKLSASEAFALLCLSKTNNGILHCGSTCCGLILYTLILFDLIGLGFVGLEDDFIKIIKNSTNGLKQFKHLKSALKELSNVCNHTEISLHQWIQSRVTQKCELVLAIGGRDWFDVTLDSLVTKEILRKQAPSSLAQYHPRYYVSDPCAIQSIRKSIRDAINRKFNLEPSLVWKFMEADYFMISIITEMICQHKKTDDDLSMNSVITFLLDSGSLDENDHGIIDAVKKLKINQTAYNQNLDLSNIEVGSSYSIIHDR